MQKAVYVEKLVDLMDPKTNFILNMTLDEAIQRVASGDPGQVRGIDGQFALLHKQGNIVRMARSIGRPMRYFLAKQTDGPLLIVAERIEQIHAFLVEHGLADQFHPSYTRMVPAHYVTELALLGCPDPSPTYTRYLRNDLPLLSTDVAEIGAAYIGALADEIDAWLNRIDDQSPIGVLFSGGIDSGAALLITHHLLLKRGQAASRLKAFTLSVDGTGQDARQASDFLKTVDLDYLLEVVEVPHELLNCHAAIRAIEDYKPLDVQSATMALALCQGIRQRYPDWRYLLDGDGGDENLRDYPIEDNQELTIRSVLSNPFFYHEGWGVDKVKHSLTYSGGQSRGHVRTYAPASLSGFQGFSPFATPNVIAVAERIPFIDLTGWEHAKLYQLKGTVTSRGVEAICNMTMPVYEKKRFQHGAADERTVAELFPQHAIQYRQAFAQMFQ